MPALFLLVGRHAGWTDPIGPDAPHHEPQRPLRLGPVEPDLTRRWLHPEATTATQQLEVVAHEPLILLALPDESPALWRRLQPLCRVDEVVERLRRSES